MVTVDVDGRSVLADSQPKLLDLGLRVGGHLVLGLHSSNELGELSLWLAMMTDHKRQPCY